MEKLYILFLFVCPSVLCFQIYFFPFLSIYSDCVQTAVVLGDGPARASTNKTGSHLNRVVSVCVFEKVYEIRDDGVVQRM